MQNQNTERNIQEQIKVRRSDQKSILDKRKYVVQHKIDRKGSLKIFIRNVSRRISPPLSFFSCAFLACIMNLQHEVQRILKGDTYRTGTRGSIKARCWRLRKRSLKRLPSGYALPLECAMRKSRQQQTFSSLRLSARSSPNCTVGWSSGTMCFPSLRPAKPDCFIFCCNAILRWSRSFSFSVIFRAIDFRILLIAPKDISMRFRAARSASARFFVYVSYIYTA